MAEQSSSHDDSKVREKERENMLDMPVLAGFLLLGPYPMGQGHLHSARVSPF
jgi:hypothetical protein